MKNERVANQAMVETVRGDAARRAADAVARDAVVRARAALARRTVWGRVVAMVGGAL